MKQITIGIMGALVCNENLGCVALSYSLMTLLEQIRKKHGFDFKYIIFEQNYEKKEYIKLAKHLNIPLEKIENAPICYFFSQEWKIYLKHINRSIEMKKKIKKCDFVIDITRGDSFTDLYGCTRFLRLTKIKDIVEKKGIPLILAPQTYGPFEDEKNQLYAKKIIEKAEVVMSRDNESALYLNTFCDKKVHVLTDLAFGLPYCKVNKTGTNLIKVGLNPSGLLISNKVEGTQLNSKLSVDYDRYIEGVLMYLTKFDKYEVHLIPHVGDDAVPYFSNLFDKVIRHPKFSSPIEAKNCISQMDVFIGSRMHATIGAISSGVATIPVAYSKKFAGLFKNIGYQHIIDLCLLDTETAIQDTIVLIDKFRDLVPDVASSYKLITEHYRRLLEIFESTIINLIC